MSRLPIRYRDVSPPLSCRVRLGRSLAFMSEGEPQERRTLVRWFFGRPRIWVSCLWLAVGLAWLGLALSESSAFRYFIAALWILMGGGMLIVALRDRTERNRR